MLRQSLYNLEHDLLNETFIQSLFVTLLWHIELVQVSAHVLEYKIELIMEFYNLLKFYYRGMVELS